MTKDPTQAASSAPSGQVPGGSHALTSSPASTGGAGTFFEQHVNAYWLAQLLVQAIPPILKDCTVAKVSFQTEHLGWHTDVFLIIGRDRLANERKLAGQSKMNCTVSAAN